MVPSFSACAPVQNASSSTASSAMSMSWLTATMRASVRSASPSFRTCTVSARSTTCALVTISRPSTMNPDPVPCTCRRVLHGWSHRTPADAQNTFTTPRRHSLRWLHASNDRSSPPLPPAAPPPPPPLVPVFLTRRPPSPSLPSLPPPSPPRTSSMLLLGCGARGKGPYCQLLHASHHTSTRFFFGLAWVDVYTSCTHNSRGV